MKLIIDAQLPVLIRDFIINKGFDAIHTDNLPEKECTKDRVIRDIANKENRIVISKDSDFYESHILLNSPKKLLWISTGDIKNNELMNIFRNNFDQVCDLFDQNSLIELDNTQIIIHH